MRAGDTLGAIAANYGVATSALASANGLVNADSISTGHVLGVQLPPYTIRVGDTLGAIAARFGRSISDLSSANGIADANVITVGQVLRVGGGSLPAVAHLPAPSSVPLRPATTATPAAPAAPALAPAATPAAPALVGSGTYTVQSGDSLGAIAARFDTWTVSLVAANHLPSADAISVGQVLQVGGQGANAPKPAAPAAPAAAAAPPAAPGLVGSGTYTVQSGDSLGAIAARFDTWTVSLVAANHLPSADAISVGQVLQVGGQGANAPKPVAAAPVAAVTPAAPTAPPLVGSGTYTVQPGDTLGAIAAKFDTWTASLVAANHLPSANAISVGQVLQVGGQGANAPKPVAAAPVVTAAAPAPVKTTPVSAPAPAHPPAASGAALAVQTALAQVGKPYVWGGAGPSSFDCSGLVMYAWAAAGVSVPHYSGAQYESMTHVSMSDLQPGDAVFFADPGEHEAMYIGGGKIVEGPYTGADVRVVSLYSQFVLAARP